MPPHSQQPPLSKFHSSTAPARALLRLLLCSALLCIPRSMLLQILQAGRFNPYLLSPAYNSSSCFTVLEPPPSTIPSFPPPQNPKTQNPALPYPYRTLPYPTPRRLSPISHLPSPQSHPSHPPLACVSVTEARCPVPSAAQPPKRPPRARCDPMRSEPRVHAGPREPEPAEPLCYAALRRHPSRGLSQLSLRYGYYITYLRRGCPLPPS
ncbi:hypothetical protein BDV95DRAFT_61877 [Massariosphaeria phaeospora]|uniref:Uncharacterized protein n=1 Tax=Massariosphaeria phaeospora TaxID=100035 RepID=A0A7C8MJ17_9PLEO|nr:hypothetical protein BDV95DRAFT_61877 [Massariosphaeria phaeospora]